MSEFNNSRWIDSSFSQIYREYADDYIPERYKLIEITKSLYKYFLQKDQTNKVLDLGCGDGLIIHELLKIDDCIDATLVDGSSEMLDAARKRLDDFKRVRFVNASFQDLLAEDPLPTTFDFILSSLAIHHLKMNEKELLFEYIYHHLNPEGLFLNIDVILSPDNDLEDWYLSLWKDWIDANVSDSKKPSLLPIPQRYKDNPDNTPDTLSAQLQALERVGFKNVDCYYKCGIFTMFGGKKGPAKNEMATNAKTTLEEIRNSL